MNYLLLLLALLLAALPATAQNSLSGTQSESSLAAQAAPDTAAALHRLFKARRRTRLYVVGGTTLAIATAVTLVLTTPNDDSPGVSSGGGSGTSYGNLSYSSGGNAQGDAATAMGILSIPVFLTEFLIYNRWSRHAERAAVASFQNHCLDPRIRRKLKPRYFRHIVSASR